MRLTDQLHSVGMATAATAIGIGDPGGFCIGLAVSPNLGIHRVDSLEIQHSSMNFLPNSRLGRFKIWPKICRADMPSYPRSKPLYKEQV